MVILFIIMRIMRTNNFIRIASILFVSLGISTRMYAQADYVYKGLRFNDSDKELQYWDGNSNVWKDAQFNMHLSSTNKVKCTDYFKLRHNSRTSLYAPIKKATPITSLKPTCEPRRVRKTIVMGDYPSFFEVTEYINSPQYQQPFPIDFYIVDKNDAKIGMTKAKSTIFLMIINNSDSLFRAHLVGQRGENTNYDIFDDKKTKDEWCRELIILPHSVSRYEMPLDKYIGLNELLLVSYIAPKSLLRVEDNNLNDEDSISYYCINEGLTVRILDLLKHYKEPNGGLYHTVFNYSSFITTKK